MSDFDEMNAKVIDEFRANGGRVGGLFEGAPMVLLTTTGARTGNERVNPLMCLPEGDRLFVFASKAGAPDNPDWYHNLKAHPSVTVEYGTERFPATATEITGPERDRLYAEQASRFSNFAEYEQMTSRAIPVVALDR